MRLGIDWGGTKLEIIALSDDGTELYRKRVATPQNDYDGCIRAVMNLVEIAENETGQTGTLGLGIPGSISPSSGLVKNANSTWLNGNPLDKDLEAALGRRVRVQNDANCLAVSEATDGAGVGFKVVHAIVIGTGCGTGISMEGKPLIGANGISGEWGSTPIPWMREEEFPGPVNWTGKPGTIDMLCSGTGFEWDYEDTTGIGKSGREIVSMMRAGDEQAQATYQRYLNRLARAMAMSANLLDPDCFVLGGGMSNVDELYDDLAEAMRPYIFSDGYEVIIRKAKHGDSSGVRGAAWLWSKNNP
ncbi:ROK family protein [Flexibacterium corallicola]|uniref:ROK family protein n=1 Tax=Flexibacterium corallicola TaxID=3037259 RepID=UPI00286F1AF1|nr:ROK family protein [Pseudovibrio sp. M1P-2-3]